MPVWGEHPLGYPITGPLRERAALHDARRARHFQRFYGAANMVLCVAGPHPARRVERAGRARRSPACRAARAARPLAPRAGRRGPRFRAVHNESAQTQVQILFHALPETDPDYLALRALMRVLDDGMSTRLHYQICDQKGLAYSVAGQRCTRTTTPRCSRSTPPARTPSCRRCVARRWRCSARFRDEPVSRGRARQGQAPLRERLEACYDDLDGLCGWFGGTELFARAALAGAARARARPRAPRGHPRAWRAA